MEYQEITIEDVINNRSLLQKVLNTYNSHKKYREKNKDKISENSKNYYYKINQKEPKKENKTQDIEKYRREYRENKIEDIKEYQRQYREKLKEKRQQLKED